MKWPRTITNTAASKWAGEEAGSVSALSPNYLLLEVQRWEREEEEEGGTDAGQLKETGKRWTREERKTDNTSES